jgi:hypothetical protein
VPHVPYEVWNNLNQHIDPTPFITNDAPLRGGSTSSPYGPRAAGFHTGVDRVGRLLNHLLDVESPGMSVMKRAVMHLLLLWAFLICAELARAEDKPTWAWVYVVPGASEIVIFQGKATISIENQSINGTLYEQDHKRDPMEFSGTIEFVGNVSVHLDINNTDAEPLYLKGRYKVSSLPNGETMRRISLVAEDDSYFIAVQQR